MELAKLNPGDYLAFPGFLRATFGAGLLCTREMFPGGMGDVYDELRSSVDVLPINPNPTVPGDTVTVVDLATTPAAIGTTVVQLATWLDSLDWRVQLRRLEPVSQAQTQGSRGESERRQRKDAGEPDNPFSQFMAKLDALGWLVALLAVAVILWLLLKVWREIDV